VLEITRRRSNSGSEIFEPDRLDCERKVYMSRSERMRLRRALTKVAAGHGGMNILKDFADLPEGDGVPEFINKTYDEAEVWAYRDLQRHWDPLLRFTPRFHGEVHCKEHDEEGRVFDGRYIRLTNLLRQFKRGPHVMDCKVGIRSFREAEVGRSKLRKDLYEKLVELDPNAATPEEREAGGCTKHRWMSFNDSYTSLQSLGFRIDGIVHSKDVTGEAPHSELKHARTLDQMAAVILKYFMPCAPPGGELRPLLQSVARTVLERLRILMSMMQQSAFVRTHSFVGSSLLFIADADGPLAGVFLIDFAKTTPLPKGVVITHRDPWVLGNHEDGLFIGMDNVIHCWERVQEMLSDSASSF